MIAMRARRYILCLALALGFVAYVGEAASAEPGPHIVVQNFYYALPGKAEAVYQWRLHASDVRVKLGLRPGRVLKIERGLEDGGRDDFADVVWECDYPDAASRAADNKVLDGSAEFDAVQAHMRTLIGKFRRVIYEDGGPGHSSDSKGVPL